VLRFASVFAFPPRPYFLSAANLADTNASAFCSQSYNRPLHSQPASLHHYTHTVTTSSAQMRPNVNVTRIDDEEN
jgi:hypothetical protein